MRRNSFIQRIAVIEKNRPIFEKQAKYHGNQFDKKVELHQIWWKSKIIEQIMKQIQNLQN